MLPWILIGLGGATLLYFLNTMGGSETRVSTRPKRMKPLSAAERKRIEKEAKRQAFIKENPASIAALLVTDPELAAAKLAEGQAYSDSKVSAFQAMTPEQRKNYKGGF